MQYVLYLCSVGVRLAEKKAQRMDKNGGTSCEVNCRKLLMPMHTLRHIRAIYIQNMLIIRRNYRMENSSFKMYHLEANRARGK